MVNGEKDHNHGDTETLRKNFEWPMFKNPPFNSPLVKGGENQKNLCNQCRYEVGAERIEKSPS